MKTICTWYPITNNTTSGITDIVNRYKSLMMQFNLIIVTYEGKFWREQLGSDVAIIEQSKINLSRGTKWLLFLKSLLQLRKVKCDAYFFNITGHAFAPFLPSKPIFSLVDLSPHWKVIRNPNRSKLSLVSSYLLLFFILMGLKKSEVLFVTSIGLIKYLEHIKIPKSKLLFSPFSVDHLVFNKKVNPVLPKSLDFLKEKFIVIYPGYLPPKGIRKLEFILEGMALIQKQYKDIIFLAIGQSEKNINYIKKIIDKEKLTNVFWTEAIDNSEIPSILAASNIGISLFDIVKSTRIQVPQKIYEYLAMSLPIISTFAPLHDNILKQDFNTFFIDTPDEFADKIINLYSDSELYETIKMNSYNSSKYRRYEFVSKKMLLEIDNVFDKLN